MPTPQQGITADDTRDALFLILLIKPKASLAAIRSACAEIPILADNLADQYPTARLSAILGIGQPAWERLYPGPLPAQLRPFPAMQSSDRIAPATPGDLLLHIRSDRKDLNFILMRAIMDSLAGYVQVQEEVCTFRYLDNRDLTGFVDGTENPKGEQRAQVALVGDEDPAFAGGSYIHCQRYIHDLAGWQRQPVAEQERIIGRTRADNIEFSAQQKAPYAHTKRVNLKDAQGQSMAIVRHSMPYGNSQEAGLFFIAYSRTPLHFERMLEQMIQTDSQGYHDHLLDFSRAVTGYAFFAPTIDFLRTSA